MNYLLDGDITIVDVPILIPVGGIFIFDYGTYKVYKHSKVKRFNSSGKIIIKILPLCELISNHTISNELKR